MMFFELFIYEINKVMIVKYWVFNKIYNVK
jgi:hypothetical protein